MPPVIEAHDLHKTYGNVVAVDGISFQVGAGEIFGMVGPNGAGKTTTIRLILDIFRPDRGTVTILGGPMTEQKKNRIGYMPEERGLYQDAPLEHCLTYFATLKGVSTAEARRRLAVYLERFDLAAHKAKRVKELIESLHSRSATLGYVDQAGLLANVQIPAGRRAEVRLVAFNSPEAAAAALDAGQIDAYVVLPADYRATRQAEMVYRKAPSAAAMRVFYNVVRQNVLAGQPPAIIERAISGANVTMRSLSARRDYPAAGPTAGQIVPVIAAVIFTFLVLTTSGYMLQALVSEKENRTIEVIVSSVSPAEMMAGKIVGAVAIALLQLAVWLICLIAAAWVGGNLLDFAWLRSVQIGWRDLLPLVAVALPAYFCIAALMTLLGTLMEDGHETQQASGLFFLPLWLPIYLVIPIAQHPTSPLAVGLSLFPLTSVMTLGMRSVVQEVARWEFGLAALIALACGLATVWLAARTFRASMLRYGQRLDLRKALGRV